jgi:hypothetical protein
MDICWKRKKIKNGTNGSRVNLVAVLVGNSQQENNSGAKGNFTRQLGAIGEKFLNSKARDMRAFHQGLFWLHVDKKLNHLSLSPEAREQIELKISQTVPRPDKDWALWSVTCIPRYDP